VQIGQVASVDTRNGVIPGRVVRIDPAVENGTVTVDVTLKGALPRGARPDLSAHDRQGLLRASHPGTVAPPRCGVWRRSSRGTSFRAWPQKNFVILRCLLPSIQV